MNPNVLDLFAGAGGFSKGFHDAGYLPGVMIDFNNRAVETLDVNFSHHGGLALHQDLSKLLPSQLEKFLVSNNHNTNFDVVIGGPPCQGWSMIGRGKLRSLGFKMQDLFDDPRNRMYTRYIKFVEHFQPKVFVMENVPGMLRYNGINVAEKIAEYFNKKGYAVNWAKVNAKNFGVPQNRERLFFVGVRNDLGVSFEIPLLGDTEKVTIKEAISDLPVIQDGSKEWIRTYNPRGEISEYAKKMRRGADPDLVFDHVCKQHRAQDIEAFRFLSQGQLYKDLPAHLKRYRDDIFDDKYRKLKYNDVSGCVTAHLSKDQYSHLHPTQARAISVREAARLQSFPDSYYFAGGMTDMFKLIGNAVAPLVAEHIATEIKSQIFTVKNKSKKSSIRSIREINV